MLIAPTSNELDGLGKLLTKHFSKYKPWLQWWMQGDISGMIFKARQVIDENSWNVLPSTTNAQEAKHTDYYRVA